MILVILGAGASFDSVPPPHGQERWDWRAVDWMPPVTDDLFADKAVYRDILKLLSGAPAAIDRVLDGLQARGSTVEVELQSLLIESEAGDAQLPRQLLEITYYLQAVLWRCSEEWSDQRGGMSNYVRLVSALEQWRERNEARIAYVTFNYDTLLERAITRAIGEVFDGPGRFEQAPLCARDTWALFKLHGSVDWGRVVAAEIPERRGATKPSELSPYARMLERTDDFVVLRTVWQMGVDQRLVIPAIAIPAAGKEYVMPQAHVALLDEWVGATTAILDVGWRGADEDFKKTLQDCLAAKRPSVPIDVVTGSADGAAKASANFRSAGLTGSITQHSDGFNTFVRGPGLGEFLGRLTPASR